jgi:putative addiction module component (TIGR02574 family)
MTQMERLTLELLGLPKSTRAMLADRLLASLEETETPPEILEKWIAVAKRRGAELAEGKVQGIPAEEVFRRARERLR